ncbi:MAG: molybdate ABC transporter substrate-binding protein [Bacillota bacterium]|nr:molybdate ABC transporter substrate-binding protein [Bacillota bacterium]
MKKVWVRLTATLLCFTLATALIGCTRDQAQEATPVLTVAAASDLLLAFQEIGELYTEQTGIQVQFNFGSTGLLAQQIANGAPVDLFAAANIAFVDRLRESRLIIDETQEIYARGRIALAKQKGSNPGFDWDLLVKDQDWSMLQAISYRNMAIANPEHAPYGTAAKEFLVATENWSQVENKLVYGSNIRDALNFILSGNAEVGIIALSIANRDEVDYLVIPEELHLPLSQSLAVIKSTKLEEEARAFSQLVLSDTGREILSKYGFEMP